MKLKITGYIDNTYTEIDVIERYNVMGISMSADDMFLTVGYEEDGKAKTDNFTSLQWAKGVEITP